MASTWPTLPNNVGAEGGDLPTRRFALVVMLVLTLVAVPWLGLSYAAVKIVGLAGAIIGTLFLMAGLVFLQKTHFAGLMLIPAPLAIVGLSSVGWRWAAVLAGVVVIGVMVQNLVTRRCGFNKLLGINSCECDTF
jgi:hypothetical protein